MKQTIFFWKLRVHIKDNNNSPHGKFHRFLFPFSSKFPDLNFAPYVLYIYSCYETRTWHQQWAWDACGVAGIAKGIASRADILRGASRLPAPRISSLKEFQNYLSYYLIIILFIVACNFYRHVLPSG